jgi:hypothetical protein
VRLVMAKRIARTALLRVSRRSSDSRPAVMHVDSIVVGPKVTGAPAMLVERR